MRELLKAVVAAGAFLAVAQPAAAITGTNTACKLVDGKALEAQIGKPFVDAFDDGQDSAPEGIQLFAACTYLFEDDSTQWRLYVQYSRYGDERAALAAFARWAAGAAADGNWIKNPPHRIAGAAKLVYWADYPGNLHDLMFTGNTVFVQLSNQENPFSEDELVKFGDAFAAASGAN